MTDFENYTTYQLLERMAFGLDAGRPALELGCVRDELFLRVKWPAPVAGLDAEKQIGVRFRVGDMPSQEASWEVYVEYPDFESARVREDDAFEVLRDLHEAEVQRFLIEVYPSDPVRLIEFDVTGIRPGIEEAADRCGYVLAEASDVG